MSILFNREIGHLPPNIEKKLRDRTLSLNSSIKKVHKIIGNQLIGTFINVELKTDKHLPIPDFNHIAVTFMVDDLKSPISFPRNQRLFKENIKNLNSQENAKFETTYISDLIKNLYTENFIGLSKIGSSFIFQDSNGLLTALKAIDIYRILLFKKFEHYIVTISGSLSMLESKKLNTLDIFMIIDDNDVRNTPKVKLKKQMIRIFQQISEDVTKLTSIKFKPYLYLLTEIYDNQNKKGGNVIQLSKNWIPFYGKNISK
jgi:hypothetical protein